MSGILYFEYCMNVENVVVVKAMSWYTNASKWDVNSNLYEDSVAHLVFHIVWYAPVKNLSINGDMPHSKLLLFFVTKKDKTSISNHSIIMQNS